MSNLPNRKRIGNETQFLLKYLDRYPRAYQIHTQGTTTAISVPTNTKKLCMSTEVNLSKDKLRTGYFRCAWLIVANPKMNFSIHLDGSNKIDFSIDSVKRVYGLGLRGGEKALLNCFLFDEVLERYGVFVQTPEPAPYNSKVEVYVTNPSTTSAFDFEAGELWTSTFDEYIQKDYLTEERGR